MPRRFLAQDQLRQLIYNLAVGDKESVREYNRFMDSHSTSSFAIRSRMATSIRFVLCCWVAIELLACSSIAQEKPELKVNFSRDIQPILSENCYYCHGQDANVRQADLRLDIEEDAQAVFVKGDADDSDLYLRICSDDADEKMPPRDSNRKLSLKQIDLIKRWINQGGEWAVHWAYVPIEKKEIDPDRAIDFFVQKKLKQNGLTFSPQAEKSALVRRVSLDLKGLPPTIEEIDRFLNDESTDAYSKMVDRFLESPAYGERMAWVWLDAARYADTNGYQGDQERTMWPWRDWVIRSFNENMPFDKFSTMQLAGDLLPDATNEQILATAFNRNHPINGEGGRIPEENRIEYGMDMAETAGTVWMGLTFNCCRCHDHKYDQLTQNDYYSLFAYFNQTPIDGSGGNGQTPPVIAVPSNAQAGEQKTKSATVAKLRKRLNELKMSLGSPDEAWESTTLEGLEDEESDLITALNVEVDDRSDEQTEMVENAFYQQYDAYVELEETFLAEKKKLKQINRAIPKVMVMADKPTPRKSFRLNRGSYREPLNEVSARVPEMFEPSNDKAAPNRLSLANWMFDESNPLTARVTVNRIWVQFFGTGLVKTTEDFGVQGEPPSHPELLDWLAAEYRDSGWNTKHVVRLIVNSQAYRQSSKSNQRLQSLDPDNRLLGRASRFRMPAWMLRDNALAASGRLVRKIGGGPVNSYQPGGVWEEASFGKKKFMLDSGDKLYRRSIYTFWRRIAAPTMFFDNADRMTCSVKSFQTNTPLHALSTLNDVTFVEAARLLATDVMTQKLDDSERLEIVFRRVDSRLPDENESAVLLAALTRTKDQYRRNKDAATAFVSIGESEVVESLDVVELGSWTSLCLAVLNLDEALTRQ